MEHRATLYRMVTEDHICPFGIKSKDRLRREGLTVDDRPLRSRAETDAFKAEHHVKTTPQTFIDGQRIGGYDELRQYFNLRPESPQGPSYVPIIAIFAMAAGMAGAVAWPMMGIRSALAVIEMFIAFSMCILAVQKLRDLPSFSNQFITYDLLAMRRVRYAYVYPFAEAYIGIGMLAGLSAWAVSPIAWFIGLVGAISVVKAVYVDRRELKCACVGGNSKVPLGAVSLAENLTMIVAGIWMLFR